MNITKLSIERPVVVIVFYLLIAILGIYSYFRLNYELVPKFSPEVITVATAYPGASAKEVEEQVSRMGEDALSSLSGVSVLTAVSLDNFSLIRLELPSGTDVDLVLREVQRMMAANADKLPAAAKSPVVSRFDFDALPVMRMGLFADLNPVALQELAKDQIVPALARIEGVAEVRMLGGEEQEIRVMVHQDKLEHYGLSILQVVDAMKRTNKDIPVGSLQDGASKQSIRLKGKFASLEEIRNVPVIHPVKRNTVLLEQLADISEGKKEQELISRVDGKSAIGIDIKKKSDANAVEMSRLVQKEILMLEERFKLEGVRFDISMDTSSFTLKAANAVLADLGFAILLVSLVMLLFLHSIRNSVIVLLSIPLSILSTFTVMYLLGYSLNLLSLLGLSLAIGILVDDSIVVVENTYRHFEMGKGKREAAYDGRMEIGFTAISITLIDVVVFFPLIFSTGLVADLLRQFGVVILVSTLMSLLVSFTLVPLVASRFGKLERLSQSTFLGRFVHSFEGWIDQFSDLIVNVLKWAFGHRIITLAMAFFLLLGAFILIPGGFIGIEFVKGGDRGEFLLELRVEEGSTLSKTSEVTRQVEDYLMEIPEVEGVFTTVGITSSGRIEFATPHLAEVSVKLIDKKDRERSASLIARQIKLELEGAIPGLAIRPIDINLLGLRDDDAVQVAVLNPDKDKLNRLGTQVENILDQVKGTVEVTSTSSSISNESEVSLNEDEMALLKVNPLIVGATLRTAVFGNQEENFFKDDQLYPINIQLSKEYINEPEDLLGLTVINENGQLIKLNQLAQINSVKSSEVLERTNRSPSVTIKSQIMGRTAGQVNNDFRSKLKALEAPEGTTFLFGGQSKRTKEGIETMIFAFSLSVFLVYFVLVILYNSFNYPFVVLLSIPMALVGALLALALTKEALSIFSILGLVMLVGLVGKNAILVVDFTNRLREKGMQLKDALIKATRLRFRPVLMTNISMIIGLIPIALASGAGSEWKNGLAWAIIGGLSSSMILTLVVVPVVYSMFSKEKSITKEKV
ncbi:efflux RND transporter permease subunit [Echinicola shivajiensis]|uniref:efflux RND transporter permease subunit n=1 Tax=Echinicola shivajiensis TaxID=1035916 RepID=UPI001BFC7DCE|nr:efflux RND transporter permease subunit [Echinicola shivajiensis]